MIPPSYRDLGKMCRDLLDRNYLDGPWRIRCRTGTSGNLTFTTFGQTLFNSPDKVFGSIEVRHKLQDLNTMLAGRWHTDDTLYGEVVMRDNLLPGLLLGLYMRQKPSDENTRNGLFWLGYGREHIKLDISQGLFGENKLTNFSAVLGYQRFLAGYQTAFNTNAEAQFHNCALGFLADNWIFHLAAHNRFKDFMTSLYGQVGANTDVGVECTFSRRDDDVSNKGFRLGARHRLDGVSLLRAKIDQDANLGLGYQRRVFEGITVILSALLVCKDARNGDHKFGFGLEFESGVAPLLEDLQQMRVQPE